MGKLFQKRPLLPQFIGEIDQDSAVLFIHGLAGSYWTWELFSHHLKTTWNESDSFGLEYEEYYPERSLIYRVPVLEYVARFFQVLIGPDIFTLAGTMESSLGIVCKNYKNVVIVTHSMGGLIARKFIVEYLKKHNDVGKVRGLITYATPHLGSKTANRVSHIGAVIVHALNLAMLVFGVALIVIAFSISWFLGMCSLLLAIIFRKRIRINLAKQVFQLKKGNEFIRTLNKDWRDLNVEGRIDFKRVVGLQDWVVDVESSTFIDDDNVIKVANKGHFSIIKPTRPKDKAFQVTYEYLKSFRSELERKMELEEYDPENDEDPDENHGQDDDDQDQIQQGWMGE